MTQRVTFLVAFDLPEKIDREVARKALQETIEHAIDDTAVPQQWARGVVRVVHHPTIRRGE